MFEKFKDKVFNESMWFYCIGFSIGLKATCDTLEKPLDAFYMVEYDFDKDKVQYEPVHP